MHITGMVHVNINCRDYDRSLEFYQMLGFEEFWRVPETNTPGVNRAVGMENYRVKGALLTLKDADPPNDLDADYAFLERQGVEIVSPPATVMLNESAGSKFFCFKDPDGTFLELVERFGAR